MGHAVHGAGDGHSISNVVRERLRSLALVTRRVAPACVHPDLELVSKQIRNAVP